MILDIIELTSGKLQVQMSESISEDLNGDTTPEVININVVLNFTKS
jgi:hypothetical protein